MSQKMPHSSRNARKVKKPIDGENVKSLKRP